MRFYEILIRALRLYILLRQVLAFGNPKCFDSRWCFRKQQDFAISSKLYSKNLFNSDELVEHTKLGGARSIKWDSTTGSFRPKKLVSAENIQSGNKLTIFLKNCFLPGGELSEDYYKYTSWRAAQRFVGATTNVFGTQALLLALGFKKNRIGLAAATTWVLKDALGKLSRVFWASKNGRKFDSDTKKWRFRSAILYAGGNALEIFTYIFPSLFLVTAALANSFKQMAMLTSSSTRNTIYKSFARGGDNIGDITAKGEAQTAVVDIIGMLAGVAVSRFIGTAQHKIVTVFVALQLLDVYCTFHEIRSVVFSTLNFERTGLVLSRIFPILDTTIPMNLPALNNARSISLGGPAAIRNAVGSSNTGTGGIGNPFTAWRTNARLNNNAVNSTSMDNSDLSSSSSGNFIPIGRNDSENVGSNAINSVPYSGNLGSGFNRDIMGAEDISRLGGGVRELSNQQSILASIAREFERKRGTEVQNKPLGSNSSSFLPGGNQTDQIRNNYDSKIFNKSEYGFSERMSSLSQVSSLSPSTNSIDDANIQQSLMDRATANQEISSEISDYQLLRKWEAFVRYKEQSRVQLFDGEGKPVSSSLNATSSFSNSETNKLRNENSVKPALIKSTDDRNEEDYSNSRRRFLDQKATFDSTSRTGINSSLSIARGNSRLSSSTVSSDYSFRSIDRSLFGRLVFAGLVIRIMIKLAIEKIARYIHQLFSKVTLYTKMTQKISPLFYSVIASGSKRLLKKSFETGYLRSLSSDFEYAESVGFESEIVSDLKRLKQIIFGNANGVSRVSATDAKSFRRKLFESAKGLRPSDIAKVERLFMPTEQGEGIVRTWSTLQIYDRPSASLLALKEPRLSPFSPLSAFLAAISSEKSGTSKQQANGVAVNDDESKEGEGFLGIRFGKNFGANGNSDDRLSHILTDSFKWFAEQHNEKFVIWFNAKVLRPGSASWKDKLITFTKYDPDSIIVKGPKGCAVRLSPQILLHAEASSADVFRALSIVHRVIHEFKQQGPLKVIADPNMKKADASGAQSGKSKDGLLAGISIQFPTLPPLPDVSILFSNIKNTTSTAAARISFGNAISNNSFSSNMQQYGNSELTLRPNSGNASNAFSYLSSDGVMGNKSISAATAVIVYDGIKDSVVAAGLMPDLVGSSVRGNKPGALAAALRHNGIQFLNNFRGAEFLEDSVENIKSQENLKNDVAIDSKTDSDSAQGAKLKKKMSLISKILSSKSRLFSWFTRPEDIRDQVLRFGSDSRAAVANTVADVGNSVRVDVDINALLGSVRATVDEDRRSKRKRRKIADAEFLAEVGLDSKGLQGHVQRGYNYVKQYNGEIKEVLKDVYGWDMEKFSYGNIKTRVEW